MDGDSNKKLVDLIDEKIAEWISQNAEKSLADINMPAPQTSNKGKLQSLIKNFDHLQAPKMEQWIKCPLLQEKLLAKAKKHKSNSSWKLRQAPRDKYKRLSEVGVERSVARGVSEVWYSQLAVASGLGGSGRHAIDLVKKLDEGKYWFIELKTNIGTNNAIYAAAELMRYALFYALCRDNYDNLKDFLKDSNKELFKAKEIIFKVSAPDFYFDETFVNTLGNDGKEKAKDFQKKLSEGFSELGKTLGMTMSFEFQVFNLTEGFRMALDMATPYGE